MSDYIVKLGFDEQIYKFYEEKARLLKIDTEQLMGLILVNTYKQMKKKKRKRAKSSVNISILLRF